MSMKAAVLAYLRTADLIAACADRAADDLCVSKSTMRRRLRLEGTSYSDLLEQVRMERLALLSDCNAKYLAWELGFTCVNNFCRWYDHQFGITFSGRRNNVSTARTGNPRAVSPHTDSMGRGVGFFSSAPHV